MEDNKKAQTESQLNHMGIFPAYKSLFSEFSIYKNVCAQGQDFVMGDIFVKS